MDTVLIVDDKQDHCNNIAELLNNHGYKTYKAYDGHTALKLIAEKKLNCLILDMRLPDISGMEILEKIQEVIDQGLIVITITAYGEVSLAVKAIKMGAFDFLEKPFDNDVLLLSIEKGLHSQKIKRELNHLRQELGADPEGEQIFGKSEAAKRLLHQIETVAQTDVTVVVQGETGSGKEVVARYLHRRSKRKNGKFVALDCGAIPESLIESELFGFEKGAFTGAYENKLGKFQLADKGTLYLDEIGNLPIEQQRRLLRVVENKAFHPIGGKKEIQVDLRLIVASNVSLESLVRENKFRSDLYYRLAEFIIHVPPLRERLDDIPHLAGIFLKEANLEFDRKISGFRDDAIIKLVNFDYPGNVRQLRNIVRKAALNAINLICPAHIDFSTQPSPKIGSDYTWYFDFCDIAKYGSHKAAYEAQVKEFEIALLKNALKTARGNISRAARLYGIDRRNFYHKLAKYNLKPED